MKKIIQKLRCRKGLSEFPAILIGFFILCVAIAIALEIYPVFVMKSRIHDVTSEMVRFVELRGQAGSVAETEFERICRITGLPNAELIIEGEFMADGVRLQLESPFTITIKDSCPAAGFSVPLTARATGRSQMYWKR